MPKKVLAIGIDPAFVDFTMPQFSPEMFRSYIDAQIERVRALGYEVTSCLEQATRRDACEQEVLTRRIAPPRAAVSSGVVAAATRQVQGRAGAVNRPGAPLSAGSSH